LEDTDDYESRKPLISQFNLTFYHAALLSEDKST